MRAGRITPIHECAAIGVTVNEYLQSVSNPAVHAAGDAAASLGPALTPVAGYDGRVGLYWLDGAVWAET